MRGGRAGALANDSLLLLTAVIWGLAFVAQRAGMDFIGPLTYNAVRFALGAVSLLPLLAIRRAAPRGARGAAAAAQPAAGSGAASGAGGRAPSRWSVLTGGLLAGGILFFGASLQQAGIVHTTAGKAGFITGLYVVLVPLAGLLQRQKAGWSGWTGAALAVCGLFLISVTDSFGIGAGDLLVLAGAFFWAAHVQVVGWLSPRVDPVGLSCVQFAVCSLLSGIGALLTEKVSAAGIIAAAVPILYGGLLSVGVAYTLQVVAQRRAPPAHAAILLSLETVFAALGGALLLGEKMGARGVVGCAVMFAGMLVAQLPRLRTAGAGSAAG
jgi:drug/metabolite transporter (DMT)-like permease